MSILKKYHLFILASLLVFLGVLLLLDVPSIALERYKISTCNSVKDESTRFQCWFDIMRDYIKKDQIERTFRTFKTLYDTQPIFAQTGCHIHAHKVGDMAYYESYRGQKTFDEMRFPQETTTCGYGFFHGFFEHLVQENPSADFVSKTCTYFGNRLGGTMGSILSTCYHGSGHGLMLAEGLKHSKKDWGKSSLFTRPALEVCDSLVNVREKDSGECREGVFNVLVNWMAGNEYGFTLDSKTLFSVCRTESKKTWRKACYYELSQKLDKASDFKSRNLIPLVETIPEQDIREMSFGVGISSIMQPKVGNGSYLEVQSDCNTFAEPYKTLCIKSIIGGLFEHGSTQEEYKPAFALCLTYSGVHADACWSAVGVRLSRFYGIPRALQLCQNVPLEYQPRCVSTAKQVQ